MRAIASCVAAIAVAAAAGCSTIQLAFDVPCRRGGDAATLRVWVVPDWRPSYWGTYMLIGDLLLPIVDVGASAFYAFADLSNDMVRTRGGAVLAPLVKLAAVVTPCVSAHREPIDLGRALLGNAWSDRERADTDSLALVLPAGATLHDAQRALVERITLDAEEATVAAARIVEVQWAVGQSHVPPPR